jgi:hypothetical protein
MVWTQEEDKALPHKINDTHIQLSKQKSSKDIGHVRCPCYFKKP